MSEWSLLADEIAALRQQLAAAQERAERAETDKAALLAVLDASERALSSWHRLTSEGKEDAVCTMNNAMRVALIEAHPGADLLADARLGAAVRAMPVHHSLYRWLTTPCWTLQDGDRVVAGGPTPDAAFGLDREGGDGHGSE